ncbi:MAG: UDP-N-acetylglucosamine 2-epimerase (non-hydrolyzing) [Deltaproteobacteria bacterium]|nr:UDP-N-acetylglucosamine 2-epimerase (non-hydrolyzing) [Myxococcales bacterium]MDP3213452.1 UDP-N-acetylglucosamine 2-epimerase (non-hydrolyzing) [Deltaproteobacteria bacterium]
MIESSPVVFVAGARPNFMKVAPMLRAMTSAAAPFERVLVHTGQHYDAAMSDVFFRELGMPAPDVHLNGGSGSHGAQTARVLASFEEYLLGCAALPRGVVVVGDVNSTMACALAAVKLGVPVAHVEAGLRSFDRGMPEEINRVVTDAICDLLLTSERAGDANLAREGIPPERVRFVGNVMIDTLVHQLPAARALGVPAAMGLAPRGYALVTLHRPSNVDEPARLTALVALLERLAAQRAVVFPTHPRTRERLERFGLIERLRAHGAILLRDPLGYRENLGLMADAALVLTDSGGIQEETTALGVPCLTLRSNTERPATVTDGTNTLVGDDLDAAWARVLEVLEGRYKRGGVVEGWDGHAAERVAQVLIDAWR